MQPSRQILLLDSYTVLTQYSGCMRTFFYLTPLIFLTGKNFVFLSFSLSILILISQVLLLCNSEFTATTYQSKDAKCFFQHTQKDVAAFPSSFFCSVKLPNWSSLCAKPQLIHLQGTTVSSVNLQCAVITSACLARISVFLRSMQGGQRNELTHLFITEGYISDNFCQASQNTLISISVGNPITSAWCVCSCMCVSHILHDATDRTDCECDHFQYSPGCLCLTYVHVPKTSVFKGGDQTFSLGSRGFKIFSQTMTELTRRKSTS